MYLRLSCLIVYREDEGRRYLMQEQEDKGLRDLEVRGAIDVTSLSSPGPTNSTISSGYCSAEEDHSYSTARPREPRTPESGSVDLSGPHTPTESMSVDLCPDAEMASSLAALGEKMNEYKSDDINLEELIDDWLDADTKSPVTTATTTTLTQATLDTSKTQNSVPPNSHWQSGFNPDVDMTDMMDIDHQGSLLSSISGAADPNESILMNLLKDSEKNGKDTHPSMLGENSNHSGGFTADSEFNLTQAGTSASTSPCLISNTCALESATMVTRSPQDPVLTAPYNAYSSSCTAQSLDSKLNAGHCAPFPLGMVGNLTDADASIPDNTQDFSLNLSSQQIGELSSYLGDNDSMPLTNFDTQTDDLNDNPFTSVLNDPNFRIEPLSSILSTTCTSSTYQSLSSSPSMSSGFISGSFGSSVTSACDTRSSSSHNLYPGLDDHRYSSRQESPTHTPARSSKGPRKPSSSRTEPSVLEKFLTTRQTLNPNKGSDAALAAQGISQLNIKDAKATSSQSSKKLLTNDQEAATLLKKLLTGEMDKREVAKHEQRVIADRRISVNSPPHTQTSFDAYTGLDNDDLAYDSQSLGLQLLGSDTADEMEKLWSPSSPDHEVIIHNKYSLFDKIFM